MRNYQAIEAFITGKLQNNLSTDLYYHGVHHTLQVIRAAQLITADEKLNEQDNFLLNVAILYHDSGFLNSYQGHEKSSCKIARADLPGFGLNEQELDIICGMIMATEIPQRPKTQLEKIIADADLDYLGTPAFEKISNLLFKEVQIYSNVKTRREWDKIQAKFISQHHYFTNFSIKNREPVKQMHLQEVLERL